MSNQPIPAIWTQFPHFFLYPLKGASALLLLGLFVVYALLFWALTQQLLLLGFIVGALMLYLSLYTLKYSLNILATVGVGSFTPPGLGSLREDFGLVVAAIGVFFVWGAVVGLLSVAGGAYVAGLSAVLSAVLFPASFMALGIEQRFMTALNPAYLWHLVSKLGTRYLMVIGLFLVMNSGMAAASFGLMEYLSPVLGGALSGLVSTYGNFVLFALMGYAIHERHEALDLVSVAQWGDDDIGEEGMTTPLLERFIQEENYEAAMGELTVLIKDHPDDVALRKKQANLVRHIDTSHYYETPGRSLIRWYMENGFAPEAVSLAEHALEKHPTMEMSDQLEWLLAKTYYESLQYKKVAKLLNGFHKRHPKSELIPDAYMLVAVMFVDRLDNDQKAQPILKYIVKTYPEHPQAAKAQQYLKVVEASTAAKSS
ncbi:conserved hypothetical protein [gamma proteobacterium HTCC5015]|nr:conserved hypothetical protein [gamma proteobacterium HTCC5015]